MKVSVDLDRCEGYANCVIEAPDVFDIDDDSGLARVVTSAVSPGQEAAVQAAVRACPARAIEVVP